MEPELAVGEHLGERAARGAGQDGTERRVLDHADEHLDPAGNLLLHEDAGHERVQAIVEIAPGLADFRRTFEADAHGPQFGLVHDAEGRLP